MILENTPEGILSDNDAAWMASNLSTVPPDKKLLAESKLHEYKVFRAQHPSPAMVERDAKNESAVLGLYEVPDKADFGPLYPTLPESEKGNVRTRVANEYFLSHTTKNGREMYSDPMAYAAERGRVAGQLFEGRGADSDTAFAAEAGKYLGKRRDRSQLLFGKDGNDEASKAINERSMDRWAKRAALAGEPMVKAFAEWKANAKTDDSEDFFPIWQQAYGAVAGKVAPYRQALDAAFSKLRQGMGVEKDGTSLFGGVMDASSALSAMSEEDFRTIGVPAIRAMAELAAGPDKGKLQQTLEAFRRPVDNAAGGLFDLLDWFGQNVSAAGGGTASLEQGDLQRTKNTLLRAVADENVDPIRVLSTSKYGKIAEQAMYDVSGSFGYMAVAAAGAPGIGASLAGYQDSNKAQLMMRNPSMKSEDAAAISAAAAPIQTALDRLSLKLVAGKLPVLSGLIGKAAAPGGNAAMRFALYGAGSVATEYTAEILQDAAPMAMQSALAAIKADVPTANWDDLAVLDSRTFFAVLPLAMLGAGVNVIKDQSTAKALLQDTAAMKAFGLSDTQIAGIQAEQDSGRQLALLQQEWKAREVPADAAQQWQDYTAKTEAAATAMTEELQNSGVTFERGVKEDGAAVYRVTKDNVVTEHDSAPAALAAVQEHMGQADREANGPLLQMLAELDENPLSPVQQTSITIGQGETVADFQARRAAVMQDTNATPQERLRAERESSAMADRQKVYEAQNPDKPVDWRAVSVGGQSELEVKDGVAKAVIKVASGQSAYTALEEKTEAEASAWVQSQGTTWTNLESMIREVEIATGDTYINGHTAGVDAGQDQLSIKEAYSELAQVHATGKGLSSKKKMTGITETARLDRQTARTNLIQAITKGEIAAELVARLKAHVAWLKTVVGKAIRLNKARREAGGAFAIDRYLNKSIGMEADAIHANEVVKEAKRIYTPPTPEQEANSIAFNLNEAPQPEEELFYDWVTDETFEVRQKALTMLSGPEPLTAEQIPGLTVFHGSPSLGKSDALNEHFRGSNTGADSAMLADFFASDERGAAFYTITDKEAEDNELLGGIAQNFEPVKLGLRELEDALEDEDGKWAAEQATDELKALISDAEKSFAALPNERIHKFQLQATNPKIMDWGGKSTLQRPLTEAIQEAAANGHDAVIFNNVRDPWPTNVVAVINPVAVTKYNPSFRLTPIETLDKLAAQMAKQTRDPDARRKVYEQMLAAFGTLRRNWTESREAFNGKTRPKSEKRSAKELNKEQAFREAIAYQDAEATAMDSLTPDAQAALGMSGENTSAFAGTLAQRFTGGRFGTKGRIMSQSAAMQAAANGDFTLGGEYDGAAGIPGMFFGGSITADNAAQEAYDAGEISEPTPDALWAAISSELQTQAGNKEAMKSALSTLKAAQKAAKSSAKAEAAAWRAEQDAIQSEDWDPRAVMLRHLRTLDAILSALPPEVRAKVGGWTAVASLKTQEAMQKELANRLEKADIHLEAYLKADALAAIGKLLDKARPSREKGQKSKGKLGAAVHRFFDEVERVAALTPKQVEAEQVALEAELVADGVTEAEQADIFEKQQALDMFGALGKQVTHDAAHLTTALDMLEQVYVEGRNRWRMLEEARLAEVAAYAGEVVNTLGGPSYSGSQKQRAKSSALIGKLSKWSLDVKSFPEIMTELLGQGNPLAKRWSRMAREAYAQKNDDTRALRNRWRDALEKATGKKGVEARRILWDMGSDQNQKIKTTTAGEGGTSTVQVPISLIDEWGLGTSDPKASGFSADEVQELTDARFAMEDTDMRESLPLKQEKRGPIESVAINEAQGVFLTMLAAQEQYSAGLDRSGWDAAAIASIEDQLSPASKSLRSFMANEYREGYAPLAKVFERMFGVGLPQIKNYAPAAFYHLGTEQVMDVAGSGTIEGGFRAGFLKNRKQHQAAPKLENAFATFFGHANQTAHWKAMAETVREMSGVFNKPEVKRAIEAAHGKEMLGALSQWMKALEGNGLQVQSGIIDGIVRTLTARQAYIALSWKLGTLFKQSSALLGSAYKMPTAAYLKGFAKLMSGRLEGRRMFASPVIQRRLETGFAPEVRAAMNDIWTSKPSKRMAFLERGMEMIGLVDAIFTTGSAAIAYDYHLQQAQKAGLSGPAAEAAAMQEVDDIVGATAQPADAPDRSLFELRQNAFGKLVFLFASESRQKSALWLGAWQNILTKKGTAADYRVLALAHFVVGPMMQVIGSAVRDARDDDDDEVFDSKNWDPLDFLRSIALGPFSGIPIVGSALSGFKDSGVAGQIPQAGVAAYKLLQGVPENEDEPVEWYVGKIVTMMQGLDAFTGTVGSVAGQVFDFGDDLLTDEGEKAAQKKRKAVKEKRDAKSAAAQK